MKWLKLFIGLIGVKISRETLYKFRKDNFDEFVSKIRKQFTRNL